MNNKRRQSGLLSVDATMALLVLAVLVTLSSGWIIRQMDAQDYRIAADQQRTIAEALSKYLKDNYAVVLANATATAPAEITVDMLRNTNYLPEGFSETNLFGQTIVGLARRPNPDQLEVIVVTTGGQEIPELGIRSIAENLGGPGGFISSMNPNVIEGVRGGWQVALSNYAINPGPGHTASALFLMDGDLANDYLYRNAIPGRADLNTMNTAINMGGNDIINADEITARNLTATETVSAETADVTGETYTGGWFRTRGDTGWYSQKWGGGIYMSDADWVRIYNNKGLRTSGGIRAGTLESSGRATVGEYLDIDSVVQEGQSCPKIGLQSKDAKGAPLTCQCLTSSCQSGVWTAGGSGPGKLASIGSFYGIVTRTNTGSSPIFVSAYGGRGSGGTCGNRYDLSASVRDVNWIPVANSNHTYDVGSKSESVGFMVPAGATYQVTSYPYACGAGLIHLTETYL